MNNKYIDYNANSTISKYFNEVKKINNDFKSKYDIEHLTLEEEIKLAKRILKNDKKAIDELVKANLRFVIKIAKQYQGHGLTLSDLISEGNFGLIKAANKFDHTKGFRFISYAVWWIRQSILFSLNENARMVRLPTSVLNKLTGLKKLIEKFEIDNEREPCSDEIKELNDEFMLLLKYPKTSSLNEPINEDGDELIDVLTNKLNSDSDDNDKFIITNKIKTELNNTLNYLSDREKDIVKCYYGIDTMCQPMTLEVIGNRYSLSKERVRQICNTSIRKIRANSFSLYKALNE